VGVKISSAAQQLQLKHAHGINLEDATPEGSSLEHKSPENPVRGQRTSGQLTKNGHDTMAEAIICNYVGRLPQKKEGEWKNNKWKSGLNKLQQSRDHSGKGW